MTDDLNMCLTEGMKAIRGLLEGRIGKPNPKAALAISEIMHNMQPNPVLLGIVVESLSIFRDEFPEVARTWLSETCAWHDSIKGAN